MKEEVRKFSCYKYNKILVDVITRYDDDGKVVYSTCSVLRGEVKGKTCDGMQAPDRKCPLVKID